MIYLTENNHSTLWQLDDFASHNPLAMLKPGDCFHITGEGEDGLSKAFSVDVKEGGVLLAYTKSVNGNVIHGFAGGGDYDGQTHIDWMLRNTSFTVQQFFHEGRLVNRVYDLMRGLPPEPNTFLEFKLRVPEMLEVELSGEWVSYSVETASLGMVTGTGATSSRNFTMALNLDS